MANMTIFSLPRGTPLRSVSGGGYRGWWERGGVARQPCCLTCVCLCVCEGEGAAGGMGVPDLTGGDQQICREFFLWCPQVREEAAVNWRPSLWALWQPKADMLRAVGGGGAMMVDGGHPQLRRRTADWSDDYTYGRSTGRGSCVACQNLVQWMLIVLKGP